MECYGIGELQFYLRSTDDNLRKAIHTLSKLEQKLGGSTGEFAAYRKTLQEIRADIGVIKKSMD